MKVKCAMLFPASTPQWRLHISLDDNTDALYIKQLNGNKDHEAKYLKIDRW